VSFRRALNTFDATMVVVGGIIGAGIFINPSLVAQRLPSGTHVLAAWIVGGVIALAGALAFAELAAMLPRAGGQYVYLREAYHPFVAFLFGWASLLLIQGGGMAAVAITFAQYASRLARRPIGSPTLLAVASLAVLALVNVLGVKPGSRLLNVLVVLKIAALAALIGGGLWLAEPAAAVAAPQAPSAAPAGVLGFGAALVPILFSYGGWQDANVIAEEVKEPRRTLPRALVLGSGIVITVYVLANVVYLAALGRDGLAATATPAADAVRRLFGAGSDRLISAVIAVSTFGFLDLTLLAPTRITWAMARDGLLPERLARLSPRFRTPVFAILLQAAWAIVLVLTGTYAGLVDSVVFADWIFFGAAVAAVLVLRRRPELREHGGFRAPGSAAVPILFVAAAALVVASVVRSNPVRAAWGVLLLATGVPVYFFFARRRRPPEPFS
jgi:APA family basic amino acid/polyamine antiporter